jgi:hypothetical protein
MITLLIGTINLKYQMPNGFVQLCNISSKILFLNFFYKNKDLIVPWISMNLDICQLQSELQKETYWMPWKWD